MEVDQSSAGPAQGWKWADGAPPPPPPSQIPGIRAPGATADASHPEATMTAASPTEPVSLGDLKADPVAAMERIGASVKRDVSDPKFWVGIAASYFGPKLIGAALPVVARAAAGMKAASGEVLTQGMAKDMATIGLGDSRVNAGLRIAGRVADAGRAAIAAPTPPAAVAPPETTPAPTLPASPVAPPSTPPPAPGPTPTLRLPDLTADQKQAIQGMVAEGYSKAQVLQKMAELRASQPAATAPPAQSPAPAKPYLVGEETLELARLLKSGKSLKDAVDLIQQQRDFAQKMGLPSATQARAAVLDRNASGRWPQ